MSGYCDIAPGHEFHGPYHDREYGFPTEDEIVLFERLSLEIMQAGLSWLIVLRKREAMNAAFAGFDPNRVAKFGEKDIARLLADEGIIRNRLKVLAIIENARRLFDGLPRMRALGRNDPVIARRYLRRIRSGVQLGSKFRGAGNSQPVAVDRIHMIFRHVVRVHFHSVQPCEMRAENAPNSSTTDDANLHRSLTPPFRPVVKLPGHMRKILALFFAHAISVLRIEANLPILIDHLRMKRKNHIFAK